MARKKRQPFTFESNLEKVIDKVHEKPLKVMNIIGQNLVREIRSTTLKQNFDQRTKILSKTIGYWARKQEKDLQIGFKMSITANKSGAGPGIVGGIMTGRDEDPIKSVVVKNAEVIKKTIGEALDEIRKE
jgi:hypothetical protein